MLRRQTVVRTIETAGLLAIGGGGGRRFEGGEGLPAPHHRLTLQRAVWKCCQFVVRFGQPASRSTSWSLSSERQGAAGRWPAESELSGGRSRRRKGQSPHRRSGAVLLGPMTSSLAPVSRPSGHHHHYYHHYHHRRRRLAHFLGRVATDLNSSSTSQSIMPINSPSSCHEKYSQGAHPSTETVACLR